MIVLRLENSGTIIAVMHINTRKMNMTMNTPIASAPATTKGGKLVSKIDLLRYFLEEPVRITLHPVLFIAPCSAVGFWRFQGPGRSLSGVPSGVW
jgi:hypothetical protein